MAKTPGNKLGRGLSALMAEITPEEDVKKDAKPKSTKGKTKTSKTKSSQAENIPSSARGINSLPLDKLARNPDQPRRYFGKSELEELTASIKDRGVLQPILVRPLPARSGKSKTAGQEYQIVAGERRWQSALAAGLSHIPALIRDLSDQEVLEVGVVENVQRADLNPIEEALAYQALKDQFNRTQQEIADAIGKSRAYIANTLRLLNLPDMAREYLAAGKMTAGHARAVLSAPDPSTLAALIVDKGLSVRAAEDWVRAQTRATSTGLPKQAAQKAADTRKIENELSDHLGLKVTLNHKYPGGLLQIKYKNLEQLDELVKILGKN